MLDFGDVIGALELLERWRFLLCLAVAGLLYWAIASHYPGEPPTTLVIALFTPAVVLGIGWEVSAGRRHSGPRPRR